MSEEIDQITINCQYTEYDVIRDVAEALDWYIIEEEEEDEEEDVEEWDILWTDLPLPNNMYMKLSTSQRVSNFPGVQAIARKNNLSRNLNAIKSIFPVEYNFFPATWCLPSELNLFRSQFGSKANKTFIVKPEASWQGKGIFLTRQLKAVQKMDHWIAQRYIHKPRLIDGMKFDLRVYVLITGWEPLRVFVFNDGLARFATELYQTPKKRNLWNKCMHLTNYAVNKKSSHFNPDPISGHKRRISTIMNQLADEGEDTELIQKRIDDIIIKTLAMIHPNLVHSYKTVQPLDLSNSIFFHILGFDIMLDDCCKPWLLEVNQAPSLATETQIDKDVKFELIKDTVTLIGLNVRDKQYNFRNFDYKSSKSQRMRLAEEISADRDVWDSRHTGNFRKIFPVPGYDEFFEAAKSIWYGQVTRTNRLSHEKSNRRLKSTSPSARRGNIGLRALQRNPSTTQRLQTPVTKFPLKPLGRHSNGATTRQ